MPEVVCEARADPSADIAFHGIACEGAQEAIFLSGRLPSLVANAKKTADGERDERFHKMENPFS